MTTCIGPVHTTRAARPLVVSKIDHRHPDPPQIKWLNCINHCQSTKVAFGNPLFQSGKEEVTTGKGDFSSGKADFAMGKADFPSRKADFPPGKGDLGRR
jgi:hypothetical protein